MGADWYEHSRQSNAILALSPGTSILKKLYVMSGACLIMLVILAGVWMTDFFMVGFKFDRVNVASSNQR